MTVIVYGKSTTLRLRKPRPSSVRATTAKPATRRPSQLPKGQTLKLAKQLRSHHRTMLKAASAREVDLAMEQASEIVRLCEPGGRLRLALRGDYMPISWAENIRQAALQAAYFGVPVPGRAAYDPDNARHVGRRDGSTRRDPNDTLAAAIDDLLEFTRDRFHRM